MMKLKKKELEKQLQEIEWEEENEENEIPEFSIRWNETKTHFHVQMKNEEKETIRIYGWYRKLPMERDTKVHAIDIFAKHTDQLGKPSEYGLDSITYDHNPTKHLQSLNADIASAINRWVYTHLNGDVDNLSKLRSKAERPTIRIKHIRTIDSIIMKLKECRDTAIACGGTRLVQIQGDTNTAPLNIVIDVTPQAIALEGKVPKLETGMGSLMDVVRTGGGGGGGVTRNVPSASNVSALAERLRQSTDPKEKRNIRAMMRKMGHKGGARSVK